MDHSTTGLTIIRCTLFAFKFCIFVGSQIMIIFEESYITTVRLSSNKNYLERQKGYYNYTNSFTMTADLTALLLLKRTGNAVHHAGYARQALLMLNQLLFLQLFLLLLIVDALIGPFMNVGWRERGEGR